MKDKEQDVVTWIQFNNWFPIVVTSVMIASSFFLMQSKVALLEQQMNFIVQKNDEIMVAIKEVDYRVREIEKSTAK